MTDKPEELPVIFRAERSGDFKGHVTAVFPTLAWGSDGSTLTTYSHVGQHGAGSFPWFHRTRLAKPEEYAELLDELRTIYGPRSGDMIGYELKVYQRMTPQHRRAFRTDLNRTDLNRIRRSYGKVRGTSYG